jgi:IS30 family transposase
MWPRPRTYIQLQLEDRVTLASLKQRGFGIRAMARVLDRSASTISRELQCNSTATGRYGSAHAQQACGHRRARARPIRKLHVNSILFCVVEHFLRLRWSPALPSRKPLPT